MKFIIFRRTKIMELFLCRNTFFIKISTVNNASGILLNPKLYYGAYRNMTTFVMTIYK